MARPEGESVTETSFVPLPNKALTSRLCGRSPASGGEQVGGAVCSARGDRRELSVLQSYRFAVVPQGPSGSGVEVDLGREAVEEPNLSEGPALATGLRKGENGISKVR